MDTERIYLLCIWSEKTSQTARPPRRLILEEPRTGRQWGFSDPELLAAFLDSNGLGDAVHAAPADAQ